MSIDFGLPLIEEQPGPWRLRPFRSAGARQDPIEAERQTCQSARCALSENH